MDVRCPKCSSENTQAITVLRAAGTSSGSVHGGGVSYSQGGGLGGQTFSGKTSHQTELVRRFATPPVPTSKIGMLLLGILAALLTIMLANIGGEAIGMAAFSGLVAAIFFLIFYTDRQTLPKRRTEWNARAHYLRNAWFCHRCGTDWLPDGSASEKTDPGQQVMPVTQTAS